MTWLVERWVKRTKSSPGRWFTVGSFTERDAEKTVRALCAAGSVARATCGEAHMKAYPKNAWRKRDSFGFHRPL